MALEGETVEIRGKRLHVDGVARDEPYAVYRDPAVLGGEGLPAALEGRDELAARTLPEGTFFALGDNRDESRDSRSWGPVPRELARGRALFVYWSVEPAPGPIEGRSAGVRRALDTAIHFLPRTRWDRTFRVVR